MAAAHCGPDSTPPGRLPPWEAAKVVAYSKVLEHVSKRLGQEPAELLGERVDAWVAKQVALKGGGHPDTADDYNQQL